MADSYAETPEGILLVANGFDPVLRWDGLTTVMETAGLTPPVKAPVLSSSGKGAIVGDYLAYLRFVDRNNNVSNLSPVSAQLTASGGTGTITGASNATPVVITSANHGLTNGTIVKITGVGGNTVANGTWTITVVDNNNFSLNGASGTDTYTGGGTWISGASTITYSNLDTPTDSKVTRRQLLRNTDGETDTFYVDIDTTDLTSGSLSSTATDTTLATGIAVPLLDTNGATLANRYTPPPQHKGVLTHHLDRMFAAVQYDYTQGACKVTFGSTQVQGVNTEWGSGLVGRYLYVTGANQSYLIDAVNVASQILTLDQSYQDTSDTMAVYAIRPAPAEERLVYYSEAGLPEAWPVTNAIEVQDDGDTITGLMAKGSYIYILELRHIYRFTFQSDPAQDGGMFLTASRGCLNHRCWISAEGIAYMMDEQGIHAFDGAQETTPIGAPVAQLFRPGQNVPYKINFRASAYFFAVHYALQQTVRWFVALNGDNLPRHALVYNYRTQRWWLEEFRVPMTAGCTGNVTKEVVHVFLGSQARMVYRYWEGYLDGADASAGTVRGTVTAVTLTSLTDSLATYASNLAGVPVAIVDGTGKGQMRQIVSVSGQTINVDWPWTTMPDTTSVYQVGAISWFYRAAWLPWVLLEEFNERRFQLLFQPANNPITCDMRLTEDFNDTPVTWATTINNDDGVTVRDNDNTNMIIDLTTGSGVVQKRFGGQREVYIRGTRYGQIELAGFTNQDQISFYQITFDGVTTSQGRS